MARIGLLGGSFNPAHHGHRHISLQAARVLGLDEVWWLVSPGNPLKEGAKDMAPFEARLASAKRMSQRAPIRVSDFEQRQGTRYTIDTVRRLKRLYSQHRFIWLLGSDTLPNFHKWRDWRGLAGEVPIAVIRRSGYDSAARAAHAMGWLEGSSILRARLFTGRTGVHRRSICFACSPIRHPRRPFARTIRTGIAGCIRPPGAQRPARP